MDESEKRPSIWCDDWESLGEEPHEGGAKSRRLPRGELLGATLYELPPSAPGGNYHFHHGIEELLIVLRGQPTLRTPEGERNLDEGEVVHFERGPDGAHSVSNETDDHARFIMVSNLTSPDAVEYPDSHQLSVMARTESQTGGPLWDMRTVEE